MKELNKISDQPKVPIENEDQDWDNSSVENDEDFVQKCKEIQLEKSKNSD